DLRMAALAVAVVCGVLASRPAAAQCENPADTAQPLNQLVNQDINNINLFIQQEANPQLLGNNTPGGFIDNIIESAFGMNPTDHGLFQYYTSFYNSVEQAMSDWMNGSGAVNLSQTLKSMTMELHASQVDQTHMIGELMDAQAAVEEKTDAERLETEAHRRYQPSELACELDSTGPGLARAFQISRAFNRGLAQDDDAVATNAINSFSQHGRNEDLSYMWNQYVTQFCDPTMGDQGCTAAGPLAGREKNIGALLWGPQQTIDPTNKQNILVMQSALRYIVDPLTSDPLPAKVAATPGGHVQILLRHSQLAYINDIYNVLGAMLSERLGGSGIDVSQMENKTVGLPATETAPEGTAGASYMEIMDTMTRDRFEDPYYLMNMIGDKSQVEREQTTLDALRLETMNDTFHRLEDRLFMESAEYARDLDHQLPEAAPKYTPMK
ncbi:MAG: hypothetical protein KGQ70_03195, partial [Alphaproteobacteria bacterium]|nr:hypothetical protein [Alphaproteobacteria bacterium]